jgi:hypothetical protein
MATPGLSYVLERTCRGYQQKSNQTGIVHTHARFLDILGPASLSASTLPTATALPKGYGRASLSLSPPPPCPSPSHGAADHPMPGDTSLETQSQKQAVANDTCMCIAPSPLASNRRRSTSPKIRRPRSLSPTRPLASTSHTHPRKHTAAFLKTPRPFQAPPSPLLDTQDTQPGARLYQSRRRFPPPPSQSISHISAPQALNPSTPPSPVDMGRRVVGPLKLKLKLALPPAHRKSPSFAEAGTLTFGEASLFINTRRPRQALPFFPCPNVVCAYR